MALLLLLLLLCPSFPTSDPNPCTPQHLEGPVYAAGVPSHKLFGGMAYFIKGDQKRGRGNLLIDTPDADPALVEAIKGMGGLEYIGACVDWIDH